MTDIINKFTNVDFVVDIWLDFVYDNTSDRVADT